jgi:hypothetical protein
VAEFDGRSWRVQEDIVASRSSLCLERRGGEERDMAAGPWSFCSFVDVEEDDREGVKADDGRLYILRTSTRKFGHLFSMVSFAPSPPEEIFDGYNLIRVIAHLDYVVYLLPCILSVGIWEKVLEVF